MSKNTELKFVGQPIFKQVISLIDGISLNSIVKKHNADYYYYKAFKAKTHLVTVLFGILSRCDSMTEICEGLRAMSGKLNLLGLETAPAKSTACDGMRNRDNKFFEDVYFTLVHHYQSFLSGSRTLGLTFKEKRYNRKSQHCYRKVYCSRFQFHRTRGTFLEILFYNRLVHGHIYLENFHYDSTKHCLTNVDSQS
ncbi:DUF4372 domain-containing protein [Sunxiuqinia indica]|uniref:DUF4372 domain-containing protein n=1 Tax=Sunxiuqinia indica TaxID=2692584 RepID=UPI00135AB19F|nr:DUF4372 domain-containing protein [Sunxiuqinia indica]